MTIQKMTDAWLQRNNSNLWAHLNCLLHISEQEVTEKMLSVMMNRGFVKKVFELRISFCDILTTVCYCYI